MRFDQVVYLNPPNTRQFSTVADPAPSASAVRADNIAEHKLN
jgi:hypothetical protein